MMAIENEQFKAGLADHYIQTHVLATLYMATSQKFSDLKPEGMENSLFMYHLRKLIKLGLVEKKDGAYCLTVKGARWANYMGMRSSKPKQQPRLLIHLIVTNEDSSRIILSKRKGVAAELLNTYLIPGGLYAYGLARNEAVKKVQSGLGIDSEYNAQFLGVIEELRHVEKGTIYHTISHCFHVIVPDTLTVHSPEYDGIWLDKDDVIKESSEYVDYFVRAVLDRFYTNTFAAFETVESR